MQNMKLLLIAICCFVVGCQSSTLRASTTAASSQNRQVQSAAVVGTIKELRWVNADSNQRDFVVDKSFVVPINTEPEFAADALDGFEVSPTIQLAMEAIVQGGPVGSIKFAFNNETYIENNAPYALCTNKGADFLPCKGLQQNLNVVFDPAVGRLHRVSAQVFASANAKGVAGPILTTYIGYTTKAEPVGSFKLYNADTDKEIDFLEGSVVNISSTPRIAVLVDAWGARFRWFPQSARIVYDNGARIVVENSVPLVFPGNSGADFLPFTPTVGTHTLSATLHSKKNLLGQNTTWGPVTFTVVV
jgi:hypothetical protein